jgi:hypothetical protein
MVSPHNSIVPIYYYKKSVFKKKDPEVFFENILIDDLSKNGKRRRLNPIDFIYT